MHNSLSVQPSAGGIGAGSENPGTIFPMVPRPDPMVARDDYRRLFCANYTAICRAMDACPEGALAVCAIDGATGSFVSSRALTPRADAPSHLVMGRHEGVDLWLADDPSLSLRHAIIVCPPASSGEMRYRLIDLRSATGIHDERGRRVHAIASEGALLVRCGRYVVFVLPANEVRQWPEYGAEDAWACLPERVYFDERLADDEGAWHHRRGAATPVVVRDPRATLVQPVRGALSTQQKLVGGGESTVGQIVLRHQGTRYRVAAGEDALFGGVLLGRYPRCDGAATMLEHGAISRVHLLLLRVDETLHAFDTGSSNGTTLQGHPVRVAGLDASAELELGEAKVFVSWRGGDPKELPL